MTTAEKIKEGCGITDEWGETCGQMTSGRKTGDIFYLCPTCQAKLSQYKSDLQQELVLLKDLWIKGYGTAYDSPRVFLEARINLIEKELKEIGK